MIDTRRARTRKLAWHKMLLLEIVPIESDITLRELAAALAETQGVRVQLPSLHRALRRAGRSCRKKG